jgi:hypothetical protein
MILVQLSVTITHVIVRGGVVLCLVRPQNVNRATVIEGWDSDLDRVVFSREPTTAK